MTIVANDAQRWPELHRVRKAVLVVDVVESVRLMQQHEESFIDRWRRFVHEVRTEVLPPREGRMVKSLGDGMLLEFESTPSAVSAAFEVQRRAAAHNAGADDDSIIALRCGLHVTEVVADDHDIYGYGVNLAARIGGIAQPGQILVSTEAKSQLVEGFDARLRDTGDHYLKHLDAPIRAWSATPPTQEAESVQLVLPSSDLRARLAVLPFDVRGGSVQTAVLGVALADDLIEWLARVPHIAVVASLSTATLTGRQLPPSSLGGLLGVDYVVQGSCTLDAPKLRVQLRLVSCRSGEVVWAGSEVGESSSATDPDSSLMRTLANSLCGAFVGAQIERADSQASLPSLESHTLLFASIAHLHQLSLPAFERARAMLEHLAERHPRSPVPHAWLGKWFVMRIGQGWSPSPDADRQRALWHTSSALERQPQHALSLTLDGFVRGYVLRDFETAETRYEQALRGNPNESLAWLFRSAMLGYREEGEQAITSALQAQSLSPIDPLKYYYDHFTSLAYLLKGDYAKAVEFGLRSLTLNVTHASTLRALVMAEALAGQLDQARAHASVLRKLEPALTCSAFKARYPGSHRQQVDRLADALLAAGIPA